MKKKVFFLKGNKIKKTPRENEEEKLTLSGGQKMRPQKATTRTAENPTQFFKFWVHQYWNHRWDNEDLLPYWESWN